MRRILPGSPPVVLSIAVACVFLILSAACAQAPNPLETSIMSKPNAGKPGAKPSSAVEPVPMVGVSRKAPPAVSPVVFEGVRYVQVMDALAMGHDQRCGYLAAYDEKDDRLLWVQRIYTITPVEHLEADVQEIYFVSMTLDAAKREIRIENEIGGVFRLNVDTRAVQEIP